MKETKKIFSRYLLLAGLLVVGSVAFGQKALLSRALNDSIGSPKIPMLEPGIHYTHKILNNEFDFYLQAVSEGKFSINFFNHHKEAVSIKVYDIIGNVLYESNVKLKGNASQQIDLSQLKTSFFIVEIKNGRFNKVKSIVAS